MENLKSDIAALPDNARLELMEWIEAAVGGARPRTSPTIEHLQLAVLRFPPDDMLDLSQWIMDITFERQPAPLGDVLERAIQGFKRTS
ncbi:MAG: hypothetical protein IAE82_12060 [Opitutaceae bacterium]|nr:hypothetical protein [Opitutaceae bacterium]